MRCGSRARGGEPHAHEKEARCDERLRAWGATGLVGIVTLLAGFSYLTTAQRRSRTFGTVGYPQQLRVLLGIAKLAGAVVLLPAPAADVEGMGLRRLHLHVDRGSRGALSGGRRGAVLAARRVARVADGFVTSRARRIAAVPRSRCCRSAPSRARSTSGFSRSSRPVPAAVSRNGRARRPSRSPLQLARIAVCWPASCSLISA